MAHLPAHFGVQERSPIHVHQLLSRHCAYVCYSYRLGYAECTPESLSWILYQSPGGYSNPLHLPPLLYMSLTWTLLTISPSCMSFSADNMQEVMVLSIELWALKVGLKIKGPKTEFMLSGCYWDPTAPQVTFLSSGLQLELVKDFKYLGTWLISSMHDFKTRRAAAWSAIRRLNRIWTATALRLSLVQ